MNQGFPLVDSACLQSNLNSRLTRLHFKPQCAPPSPSRHSCFDMLCLLTSVSFHLLYPISFHSSSRTVLVFPSAKFVCRRRQKLPLIFQVLVFCSCFCLGSHTSSFWIFFLQQLYCYFLLFLFFLLLRPRKPSSRTFSLSSLLPCVHSSSACVQMLTSLSSFWPRGLSFFVRLSVSFKTFGISFHFVPCGVSLTHRSCESTCPRGKWSRP